MKKLLFYHCSLLIVIATVFSSCSKTEEPEEKPASLQTEDFEAVASQKAGEKVLVFKGPQVQYGEGKARSFVSLDEDNFPLEIGFILTQEVFEDLESLPPDGVTVVLPLHQKATEVTPFEHLGLNWEPHGHLPVFLVPHFDFHFYMVTNEERLAIPPYSPDTADEWGLYPPEGYMPDSYGTPPGQGGVYAQMGKHWLPLNLPAYLPFTHIMVLGTYNGEFIFVEPMATLDFLTSNPDFSGAYAQPEYFLESNNYPTRYNIYTDPKTQDVYISLSDFVAR